MNGRRLHPSPGRLDHEMQVFFGNRELPGIGLGLRRVGDGVERSTVLR